MLWLINYKTTGSFWHLNNDKHLFIHIITLNDNKTHFWVIPKPWAINEFQLTHMENIIQDNHISIWKWLFKFMVWGAQTCGHILPNLVTMHHLVKIWWLKNHIIHTNLFFFCDWIMGWDHTLPSIYKGNRFYEWTNNVLWEKSMFKKINFVNIKK